MSLLKIETLTRTNRETTVPCHEEHVFRMEFEKKTIDECNLDTIHLDKSIMVQKQKEA